MPVAHASSLYYAVFPSGIEDVVYEEVRKSVSRFPALEEHLQILSSTQKCKHTLQETFTWAKREMERKCRAVREGASDEHGPVTMNASGVTSSEPHGSMLSLGVSRCSAPLLAALAPEEVQRNLRGTLFFRIDDTCSAATVSDFISAVSYIRAVEQVCMHLVSCPCKQDVSEVDASLKAAGLAISNAVRFQRIAFRSATAEGIRSHGFNTRYVTCCEKKSPPLTDNAVLFRVNGVRRDKSIPCRFSSQDLASHVGEILFDMFEPAGWRVSMLYYNVEFSVLHDQHYAHIGLVISPPVAPRCGARLDVVAQQSMEILRQRVGQMLLKEQTTVQEVKALVPRPSGSRCELRWEKGNNAMHYGLASALATYAALEPGMVLLDPFAGSGTILIEAWVAVKCKPLALVGGDLCRKDVERMKSNLSSDIGFLVTMAGLRFVPPGSDEARLMESLTRSVEEHVMNLSLATLPRQQCLSITPEQSDVVQSLIQRLRCAFNCNFTAVHGDGTHLPLRRSTVDRVVADLPFGRRCGNHGVNKRLYPALVKECYRVLRDPVHLYTEASNGGIGQGTLNTPWWHRPSTVTGGRAVLLTVEGRLLYDTLEALRDECPFHLVTQPFTVDMGGLFPYVFVLDKMLV